MSRRVFLLGVGLALVALALAFTDWALSLRPGVTEANVRRIRQGMTELEVRALLGDRPRSMNPLRMWLSDRRYHEFGRKGEVAEMVWAGDAGTAKVYLDADGLALRAAFDRAEPSGPFTRLRAWLGWWRPPPRDYISGPEMKYQGLINYKAAGQ
jgi:hypothetical protein